MVQTKQQINHKPRGTGLIDQRLVCAIVAGVSLLVAGLAVLVMQFGPRLAPAHFETTELTRKTLALSNVIPGTQIVEEREVETEKIVLAQTRNEDAPIEAPVAAELPSSQIELQSADNVAAEVKAQSDAKTVLTAHLAHQQLTRSLLSAQSETGLKFSAASAPYPTFADAGTASDGSTETSEATALVAIAHPLPRTKPQAPKPTATARANTTEDKPAQTLAYAAPGNPEEDESSVFSGIGKLFSGPKGGLPGRGKGIAVYDISAAIVHMPDGSKLEAHSGIGHRKDNPKYTHVRNLGPTPPNIYDLRMREKRFHGVEAIRMTPRDVAAMKGRDGMLAHSPLLRSGNGSHGCVAFKDYNKFLKAFKAGKVKKMIVVPSMNELPTYMAAL